MTFVGSLPPVRRPVPLRVRAGEPLEALFPRFNVRLYGSGTQALALALKAAAARSSDPDPEVILPAYGCPDLVSACVYAGVRPRLVDNASGQWGYDLAQLEGALSSHTVGIVAVNLLGVGDQAQALRELSHARGLALIQDSAQHLPQQSPVDWPGDAVIFSFGRGKPLNLMGGGALLQRDVANAARLPVATTRAGSMARGARRGLAGLAFNIATDSRVFALSSRLLGTRLGETRYKVLTTIDPIDPDALRRVASAIAQYRAWAGYDASIWKEACAEWTTLGLRVLTCAGAIDTGPLRLRLALLAPDASRREVIVNALASKGLGVSRMYNTSLPLLPGIPAEIATQGPFPGAQDLACRLLTLPTHSQVTPAAVRLARETIRRVSG